MRDLGQFRLVHLSFGQCRLVHRGQGTGRKKDGTVGRSRGGRCRYRSSPSSEEEPVERKGRSDYRVGRCECVGQSLLWLSLLLPKVSNCQKVNGPWRDSY